jgi:hypothetical protein
MAKHVFIYKGFAVVPRGSNFHVYDYAGRPKITFPSERQVRDYIDVEIAAGLKRRTKKSEKQNPPVTEIYARIKEIVAVKGKNHKCDAACKRCRHTYRHVFTSPARVLGLEDGSILIKNI